VLSKESAIILPALLLLIDAASGALRRAGSGEYARRNGAAFLLLGIVFAGYFVLRMSVLDGRLAPTRLDPVLEVATAPAARLWTALQAWPTYLRLLFFPKTLLADYGPGVLTPANGVTNAAAAGALLLACSLLGGSIALLRGARRAGFALLWFGIAILPASSLIVPIGVLVAERTLYLPSFALAIGVAAAAGTSTASKMLRASSPAAWPLRLAVASVIILLAARTVARVPEWESTDRIMLALVRDRPDAFRGQWHLARLASLNGDSVKAMERYDHALQLWPHRHNLVMEAAHFAAVSGRLERAHELAGRAARAWPDDLHAQRLLAGTSLDLGDTATARIAVRAGLRIDPRDDLLRRMNAVLPPDGPDLNE
jgi:hypothetical protein